MTWYRVPWHFDVHFREKVVVRITAGQVTDSGGRQLLGELSISELKAQPLGQSGSSIWEVTIGVDYRRTLAELFDSQAHSLLAHYLVRQGYEPTTEVGVGNTRYIRMIRMGRKMQFREKGGLIYHRS